MPRLYVAIFTNVAYPTMVATCLCRTLRNLSENFDDSEATRLASDLNSHLETIRKLLVKSKSLNRDIHWQLIPSNQRTRKILSVRTIDVSRLDRIYLDLDSAPRSFWEPTNDFAHTEIRRRIACVTIFLRSELDRERWISPEVVGLAAGSRTAELRFAGKKYIKIARKLGGIGSLFWLPLDVPSSTYERYLTVDDGEAFDHLKALGSDVPKYDDLVQRLIMSQLNDVSLTLSYHNLFNDYGDILPGSDQILFLLSGYGGVEIPLTLLKSVRNAQRRWTPNGELRTIHATDFGIPSQVVNLLSDDKCLADVDARPEISKHILEDGTVTWSIRPESRPLFSGILSPHALDSVTTTLLRMTCFACPPCYEGKASWSPDFKRAIWALFDKTLSNQRLSLSLKTDLIDALLFLAERDLFVIRSQAIKRARVLLHKSMPYYFHASVALFESNILRVNGDFDKSDAIIHNFLSQKHNIDTRCDNALMGRLHISNIENKIRRYDNDVANCIYQWEGIHPLSTFEIEVTRRLQGVAAKFFQSIGDFHTARASLEQHLWLNAAQPIRPNTRALIVGKLAEIHIELDECEKAIELLKPEVESIPESAHKGRPFRRLSLAVVEANIGLGNLDTAETILRRLADVEPPEMDDINDQMIHMRRLIANARTVHSRLHLAEALRLWGCVLERMEQLTIFNSKHKWTAAIIWLSVSHAQLSLGDEDGAKRSWTIAADISRREKCEYAIPALGTTWLQKVVTEIHKAQGWPFRVMLPGGKPDITWP